MKNTRSSRAVTITAAGLEVLLVNTKRLKHVPGRKSDVLDCQWIQQLHS